ncbi:MAG: hypothetical protein IJU31_04160, partial [Synergistaceae bacterium]|nr:hypothetical protein [Synergistaceae bacterium]
SMSTKIRAVVLAWAFLLWGSPWAGGGAAAASKHKKEKFFQLRDVGSYQLGMDELVLRIHGKDLPTPNVDKRGNFLQIVFYDTIALKIKGIGAALKEICATVPAIVDFSAENISDDAGQRVLISAEALRPISVVQMAKVFDGWSLRLKVEEEKNNFVKFEPTPKAPNKPESFLPFKMTNVLNTELRDANLQDVFRLIMEESGKNVIIDNSFPKDVEITMTLVDIRADELLNYLMNQYDLACALAGRNTIAFGTREALYKLSGEREIKSFRIAYADLAAVGTMLKNLVALQDTEYTQDDRMRTVHINTNPAKMREVEDVITRLDVPAQQVMIRASIFEFADTATKDVQIALNAVYDRWTFTSDPANSSGLLSFIDKTYSQGRSTFDRYITATLQGLENKNKGRTIANPSVIAIDGQQATITLKQDVLYLQGSDDDGKPVWGTVDVGPELTFTPKIEENGYIYLEIKITTGDYLGKDTDGNLQTTERTVDTKIRVRDGMPFVVGGLYQDNHITAEARVPILGNIPLLGELFKYKSSEHDKTQAVMIVTPYILN